MAREKREEVRAHSSVVTVTNTAEARNFTKKRSLFEGQFLRAQVDSGEAPTHRIHLWPDLVAAGTSKKDHRSLRHFSPSCHEAAAKKGRPGAFGTLPLGLTGTEPRRL